MISSREIYDFLDSFAPFSAAEDWDNSGLLVGNGTELSDTVVVTLDVTAGVLDFAKQKGARIILSHHPIIFKPLYSLSDSSVAARAFRDGFSVISAHTNLDFAPGGVNDALADALGLENIRGFDFCTSVPALSLGRIGSLPHPLSPEELLSRVKSVLGAPFIRFSGKVSSVSTVAVSGGALSSDLSLAVSLGADALISGDIKHDRFVSLPSGLLLIDAGHFYTENVVISPLCKRLSAAFPGTRFLPYGENAPFLFF